MRSGGNVGRACQPAKYLMLPFSHSPCLPHLPLAGPGAAATFSAPRRHLRTSPANDMVLRLLQVDPSDADPPAHFHLLGEVDFEDCLSLQRRLVYEANSRADGRIVVLICEHSRLISIGRGGSRADVRLTKSELAGRQLEVRYVGRGGGAILHAPGQLAIYPIIPLAWYNLTIGDYLRRLHKALAELLVELNVKPVAVPGSLALAGRGGVLAALGATVRNGVTMHGAFLNVNPDMRDFGRIDVAGGQTMSSLLSHRALATKMSKVRAALVKHLAEALSLARYHLHTGHPLLAELPAANLRRESAA